MKPVRVGVIGCGVMGSSHVAAAMESGLAEVVAVADLREARARALAEAHGIGKVYCEGADLLTDPDVEAVVIALPTFGRPYLVLRAFANGKHVLMEKPVAMNAAQVRRFIEKRGDLVAGCCSARYRLFESARVATEFVASGALGPLRVVRCRGLDGAGAPPEKEPPLWRESSMLNGGGILVNWGCYDLDYLLGIAGWSLHPEVVLAQTWEIAPHLAARAAQASDAEAHFVALIRCTNGAVLAFERGEFMAMPADSAWEITGTKGTLRLRMLTGTDKVLYHDDTTPEQGVTTRELWRGDESGDGMALDLLEDFLLAVRNGRQPMTSLEKALVLQDITDAVYASATGNCAVHLDATGAAR